MRQKKKLSAPGASRQTEVAGKKKSGKSDGAEKAAKKAVALSATPDPSGPAKITSFPIRALMVVAAPLSGALLALCFSPFDLHFLAWVAMVPLLYSLSGTSPAGAALRGWLFGAAFLGILLWWLAMVRYPAVIGYGIGCVLIPAIFIPWAMTANRALAGRAGWGGIVLIACFWLLPEWAMSYGTFAFPWWLIGNSQVKNLVVAQAASIGGVCLISFEILIANLFFHEMIRRRVAKEKYFWLTAGAVMIALVIYGAAELRRGAAVENPVTLAVVQPNYPYAEKEKPDVLNKVFNQTIAMTVEAVSERSPDMVVWSESVTALHWLIGPGATEWTKNLLSGLDTMLVAGAYEFVNEEQFNTVTVIDPRKGALGVYRKMQLVPFGEMFPYRKQIDRLSPALGKWVNENVFDGDVSAGKEYTVFDTRFGKFAALICFESVIPSIPRKMVRMGAEYMFVLTNDAWSPADAGLWQHASLGVFRAIENRRYVVQASNSGVSFIADPYGRMFEVEKIKKETIMQGTVYPMREKTLYTRYGDWVCVASFLYVILYGGFIILSGGAARKKK